MNPHAFMTTSWDDGHPLDYRIAEMLQEYGLRGTFYIPKQASTGTMPARERVAAFLLDFAERLDAGATSSGGHPVDLLLPMTRADIGSYLGLELETVSRTLSKLQREGAIGLNGRQVRIVDRAMLEHH